MDFQNINEQLLNANRIMNKNNVTGTLAFILPFKTHFLYL